MVPCVTDGAQVLVVFSGLRACVCVCVRMGGLFQLLGNFSDTVIATELKAHVCLVQPHVLMYVSLVCSRRDPSFSGFFFSIFWGFLEARLMRGPPNLTHTTHSLGHTFWCMDHPYTPGAKTLPYGPFRKPSLLWKRKVGAHHSWIFRTTLYMAHVGMTNGVGGDKVAKVCDGILLFTKRKAASC